MSRTSSIPYWTTSVFCSTVTDLVLIYESVASTTDTALKDDSLRMNCSSLHGSLYSLLVTMENVCCPAVVTETCLLKRCLRIDSRICSLLLERVFSEPLASNELPLWLHYSGFQASCQSIVTSGLNQALGRN
jgi:hypothetical protein